MVASYTSLSPYKMIFKPRIKKKEGFFVDFVPFQFFVMIIKNPLLFFTF